MLCLFQSQIVAHASSFTGMRGGGLSHLHALDTPRPVDVDLDHAPNSRR